jgi:hypothetical protein
MKTFRDRLTAGFLLMLVVLLNTGCAAEESAGWFELEVAPGKFIPVEFHRSFRKTGMTIRYNEEKMVFNSPPECNLPRTLMEFEGKLYLLALDADPEGGRDDWRYRCFRQEGKEFKEIEAKDFPRSIAIFNIWLPGDRSRYSTGIGGVRIDDVEIGKALDPENGYFVNSYQGRLWYMLEKRNSLGWAEREFGGEEGKKFLKEYIEKYKPVHLTSMEMKRIPKEEAKKLE